VDLFGCETWSPKLREWYRARVFENGPKKDEAKGGWRKLHNEEQRDSYFVPSIIIIIKSRFMLWVENAGRLLRKRRTCIALLVKPEGRRTLRRPRHVWLIIIKMDLVDIEWGGMDGIGLAKGRNKCGSGYTNCGLSSTAEMRRDS
jgi:hypothetical protein